MVATRPVLIVTGALAPYTHRLYERLAATLPVPLHVLACTPRETAREWELPAASGYRFGVLPGLRWHRDSVRNLYVNPSVLPALARLRPAAIVLNDFSPTMVMAAGAARAARIPYGIRTDGVPDTDPGARSAAHRLMRRAIVPGASFGLAASGGSRRVLERYGLAAGGIRIAPLSPAWEPGPAPSSGGADRPYDLLFCGMLNEAVKGARFFTDVALAAARARPGLTVRVVGSGPLRGEMEGRFAAAGVPARFDGFLPQSALEAAYRSAKLFLFPSRGDVWGLVVNEALQCGTPVLASPHSGAATELLTPEGAGVVEPLDVERWTDATLRLLADPDERDRLAVRGSAALRRHGLDVAVDAYREVLEPLVRPIGPAP